MRHKCEGIIQISLKIKKDMELGNSNFGLNDTAFNPSLPISLLVCTY